MVERCRIVSGTAGPGFGGRQRLPGLQDLDGDAVWRADESHAAIARRASDRDAVRRKRGAGFVDVVDGISEMPEIAPARVALLIPVMGKFDGRCLIAGGGEEDVGVAALFVGAAADFAQAEDREERDGGFEVADADHGV